jgi:peptidoglycan/LPS O-acetylase OafA/YrhL
VSRGGSACRRRCRFEPCPAGPQVSGSTTGALAGHEFLRLWINHTDVKHALTSVADSIHSGTDAQSGHIRSLDGIRGLSFLIVFFSHAASRHKLIPGEFGVTVFFFLSGYLITTLMRTEYEATGSLSLRRFWLRRALRILPPFYVVWLVAALLGMTLFPPGSLNGSMMLAELSLIENYWAIAGHGPNTPGMGVIWSLAVEEHFYLLFPFIFLLLQSLRLRPALQAWALWSLCAAVLLWRLVLILYLGNAATRIPAATDTRVDAILFGCALAVWKNPALDQLTSPAGRWQTLWVPGALLALAVSLYLPHLPLLAAWSYSVQGLALTVLFTAAIRFHRWPMFRPLNGRLLVQLGGLSYALYLVHSTILASLIRLLPHSSAATRAALALPLSLLAAQLLRVGIEAPCARLRRALHPARAPVAVSHAAAGDAPLQLSV